jgi:hypothetical protein
MDYLAGSFFSDFKKGRHDCIVWANRAGGKTFLAAIATLLDALFKPGCQVRILGGSASQSSLMYQYIQGFLNLGFADYLEDEALKTKCRFANGSGVEILTQSATSVRGQHVQKLRCDEVELFDADVYEAAKFTTISTKDIKASMELLSTMHRPYGLMSKAVERAAKSGSRVYKWCIWETIERCKRRSCGDCPIRDDCGGLAHHACGYVPVDDVIAIASRSSLSSWKSEMLCRQPSRDNLVFPEFDAERCVKPAPPLYDGCLYQSIDFGYVNPFVCLWIMKRRDGATHVIDEYCHRRRTIMANALAVSNHAMIPQSDIMATYCDPAGKQADDITGSNAIREMGSIGFRMRYRASRITDGLELIRRDLLTAAGETKLYIDPRCVNLIEALSSYHYSEGERPGELPEKDGLYDHPIDALRYYYVNTKKHAAILRSY